MCYSNPWCRKKPWDTQVLAIVQAWWLQWKWSSSDADGRRETTVCKATASLFLSSSLFLYFWCFPHVFSSAHDFFFLFHIPLSFFYSYSYFFSFSLSFTISCLLVITWFLVSCHNALIEIYSSLTLLIRFIYNLFTFDLCIFNLIVLFLLLCVLFLSRLFCVFCILALLNFFLYCLKTNKYLIY